MKIMNQIAILVALFALVSANYGTADNAPTVERRGEKTTLTFSNGQTFTLPPGKGLLGPSSNPGSKVPFRNSDGTIVAVNEQPMTKTSFVHIYLKGTDGHFTEVQHANQKIREAVPSSVCNINTEFIRVERISGRTLEVETVYDFVSNPRQRLSFKVAVEPDGTIVPAR